MNENELIQSAGKRIAQIRRTHRMTQEALAERLNITSKHVSCIENGKAFFSLQKLVEFCEVMGCTIDYILTGKTEHPDMKKLCPEFLEILQSGNQTDIDRINKYILFMMEMERSKEDGKE